MSHKSASGMNIEALIHLLPKLREEDCVVSFADGDSYHIRNLDVWGFYEDDFEIRVEFEHCLIDSAVRRAALEAGYLKTPGVAWTSEEPLVPIHKVYLIQDIDSVFHRADNYAVYEKQR